MELSYTHAWTWCVQCKQKPENRPIMLFYIWQKTHTTWLTCVVSYLIIEMPQASCAFNDISADFTLYSCDKQAQSKIPNTSRRLLVLKESLRSKSLRPMPTCGSHISCCQICIVNSELKSLLMTYFGVQNEYFMSAIWYALVCKMYVCM